MAGPTTAALDIAADAVAGKVGNISMHTADPTTTGGSEVTGGTYARQAPTYAASSGGTADLSANLTFDIPAGTTVSHWGAWSNDATPVWLGGQTLSASQNFASDGTYTLTSAPING